MISFNNSNKVNDGILRWARDKFTNRRQRTQN